MRFREFLSDRWFDLLLWCRYDLSWRVVSAGVGVVLAPALVAVLVLPVGGNISDATVKSSPVTLPIAEPAPLEFSPLHTRVSDVLVVGDSLVAGEEEIYQEALGAVGVSARFDAAVSRGLRYGWLCPRGSNGLAVAADDESSGDTPSAGSAEYADEDLSGEVREGSFAEEHDDVSGEDAVNTPSSAGCVRQGLEAITWYASSDALSGALVVALGTNDASSPVRQVLERLDDLRSLLGTRPVFLLETATYPMTPVHAGWNDTARTWCLADVSCRFVEWASSPAPAEFFGPDGVHLSVLGSRVRAAALASVLASGY